MYAIPKQVAKLCTLDRRLSLQTCQENEMESHHLNGMGWKSSIDWCIQDHPLLEL
jgi:hypothetical protein